MDTVGRALFEIRESRLYRLTHSTFEDYCRNLPPYERSKLALRLKDTIAARAKENQGRRNDIPQKSAECSTPVETRRELAKVEKEFATD